MTRCTYPAGRSVVQGSFRNVVQAKGRAFALPANAEVSARGPGSPLPAGVRQKMESFFSADFSDVRVHVGPQAGSIGAQAYTQGSDIFFTPGLYSPESSHSQRLLGHELTHVVQQRAGRVRNPFGAGVAVVQDPGLEAEAESMGLRASLFRPSAVSAAVVPKLHPGAATPPTLQRRKWKYGDEKKEIRLMILRLVNTVSPLEVGALTLDEYVDNLEVEIREKPHIFSGERYGGERIDLRSIDKSDWKYIRRTIRKAAQKVRWNQGDYATQHISRRITNGGNLPWDQWKTIDCVFAAILYVLGVRFNSSSQQAQAAEYLVESALANTLGLAHRTVTDETLVWLLERRLGWAKVPAKNRGELHRASQQHRLYILSYLQDARTDLWHTILAQRVGQTWQIIDRQGVRSNIPTTNLSDDQMLVDAWEVNAQSQLIQELQQSLGVQNLRQQYSSYLDLA